MNAIIVSGGAGFIGSAVCRYLVAETDFAVVNVDKLTYAANLDSLAAISDHPRYKFRQLDICDEVALERVFADEQPCAVMHLAAETHVDRSIQAPAGFVQTNVVGTYTLLEASRRYWEGLPGSAQSSFRFLHVSTDEVYGALGAEGMFTETCAYRPNSPYAASKASSDHLVAAWSRTYGLPTVTANASNTYGPCQFPEKLIPLMTINALEEQPLRIYGRGENVRDWIYVDDQVRALHAVLANGRAGEKYNVGARNERTNVEVVGLICDLVDELNPSGRCRRDLIAFVEDRPGHDFRYASNPGKIEGELGWRARETFESGLRRTVEWYLTNEAWWRPLRDDVYDGRRLGLHAKQTRIL